MRCRWIRRRRWTGRAKTLGCGLQGNLDPIVLIAGGAALDRAVDEILRRCAGKPHIFNLGHGILQETPIAHVEQIAEAVRQESRRETRRRPVQSGRAGFAGSGRTVPAQSVLRSRHYLSCPLRAPAAGPPHRQAPRAGGAENLCPYRRPLADFRGNPRPGRCAWKARWAAMASRRKPLSPCATGIRSAMARRGRSRHSTPDTIVLLPLYPQYSTTTTASSSEGLGAAAQEGRSGQARHRGSAAIPGARALSRAAADDYPRRHWRARQACLLSPAAVGAWPAQAHGAQGRSLSMAGGAVRRGAIVEALGMPGLGLAVCYQSRVGPLEWIGPATDARNPPRRRGRQRRDRRAHRLCQRTFRNPGGARHRISPSLREKAGVPDYRRAADGGRPSGFHRRACRPCARTPWWRRLSRSGDGAHLSRGHSDAADYGANR